MLIFSIKITFLVIFHLLLFLKTKRRNLLLQLNTLINNDS